MSETKCIKNCNGTVVLSNALTMKLSRWLSSIQSQETTRLCLLGF